VVSTIGTVHRLTSSNYNVSKTTSNSAITSFKVKWGSYSVGPIRRGESVDNTT
jgi:hypothetical protein